MRRYVIYWLLLTPRQMMRYVIILVTIQFKVEIHTKHSNERMFLQGVYRIVPGEGKKM